MKKIILAAILAALGTGCTTNPHTKQLQLQALGANVSYMKATAEKQQQLLLDAKIPVCISNICETLEIKVANPSPNKMPMLKLPEDEWARVAERALGEAGRIGGVLAGGAVASALVGEVGDVVMGTLSAQKDPTIVVQPQAQVLTQPDPVIVQQPPVQVITAPDPIIVDPVVVDPVIVDPTVIETDVLVRE